MATMAELQAILDRPSREEVEKLFRSPMRPYRVDIESASTVRADVARNQEQMAGFTQSLAQLLASIGPIVQQGVMPTDVAVELVSATTRNYQLGRQAEEALDRWADQVRKAPPQPPKQDPRIALERERAEIEKAAALQEMAIERETHVMKMQEMREVATNKEREAKLNLAERGIAARRGPDGEDEYVSPEDVRLEQNSELLKQLAAQNAATMNQMVGAISQLGMGLQQIFQNMQAISHAQNSPLEIEVIRGPDGKIAGVRKVS